MQQTKRHHFVPRTYLRAFCDQNGKLRVYRKDGPVEPLYQAPEATQFRNYYYSQPVPGGGQDNNTLEGFFSKIESDWPETVAKLHARGAVNDRLANIFEFIALQRVRVPASRDAVEASLAQMVKDSMKFMLDVGSLPAPPLGLEDLPDRVKVSIDPHRSLHAMVTMLEGVAAILRLVGWVAAHNNTGRSFITSDNPVLWFDPSVPLDEQRPYTIQPNGPISVVFPVSPKLALIGSNDYQQFFRKHGLQHVDVPDEEYVFSINQQICRFAYESVITQELGWEEMISRHKATSPIHEAVQIPLAKGMATEHRFKFGPRQARPKWDSR
jgi:hypothetical protein